MRPAESVNLSQQSDDQLGSDNSLAGGAEPKQRSGPTSRSSPFIGVTMYKKSGRWEAHIWDSTPTPAKGGKGKQLHLGSFLGPEPAAVAYDRAALKLRGPTAVLNHTKEDYEDDEFMKKHGLLGKAAFIAELRAWAKTTKPPARTRRLRTPPGATTLAEDEQRGSADSSYSSAGDRRRSVSSRRRTREASPGSGRGARRTNQELTEVGRHDQQQHPTSGREPTSAHLPYARAARLPAFQLRAQSLPGQSPAADHMLAGSQEVWQQGMPGLQAVTGGLSLSGLQPALPPGTVQDSSMLMLGGTNPMLGSSMLLDSPDSSGSALSSLNLLDVCGLHHEGWQRFQGMPGAGTPTLLPTFLLGSASSAAVRPSPASVAGCVPGFGPTLMQHALATPHCNTDSSQTGDSSAARLAAGNAAASAGGGSPRAAWSMPPAAAAAPPGPAAWSRGFQSLFASNSSRMMPPEPAAPHSFPAIHAPSLPTNLSLFTSAALGAPSPAAGSQTPPSLLGYPPLPGTETALDVHASMGNEGAGDCFHGAPAPSSYTWSAEGLFVAPGIEYLPGTAPLVPCPAHVSSPVDRATFH